MKRIACAILAITLFFTFQIAGFAENNQNSEAEYNIISNENINITAPAAILIEAGTGQILYEKMINESGVPMMCCGKKMTQIVPGTVEASKEKHIPVVTVEDGVINVNVGSVDHPMTEEHLIEWVYVQTDRGGQRKTLKAGDAPNLTFAFDDEKPIAVYAYCNLHGLWKTDL